MASEDTLPRSLHAEAAASGKAKHAASNEGRVTPQPSPAPAPTPAFSGSDDSPYSPSAFTGGFSTGDDAPGGPQQCGPAAGTFPCSMTPVPVAGGLSFASVTAGASYTCGLTTANVAYCWGENFGGQLGDGTMTFASSPVAVLGGLSFTALSASAIDSGRSASIVVAIATGHEPSFETVLRTMHEAGYIGDVYPSPSMWRAGQTGVYARFPFTGALDQMRGGGF